MKTVEDSMHVCFLQSGVCDSTRELCCLARIMFTIGWESCKLRNGTRVPEETESLVEFEVTFSFSGMPRRFKCSGCAGKRADVIETDDLEGSGRSFFGLKGGLNKRVEFLIFVCFRGHQFTFSDLGARCTAKGSFWPTCFGTCVRLVLAIVPVKGCWLMSTWLAKSTEF